MRAWYAFFTLGVSRDVLETQALRDIWDAHLRLYNTQADTAAKGAFHVSEVWAEADWRQAFRSNFAATITIVVLLSAGCCFTLTRSLMLSCYVLIGTVGAEIMLFFFVAVYLEWHVGPLELVIAISCFGYSATYPLYIVSVHASNVVVGSELDSESAEAKLSRIRFTLRSSGFILGGAVSFLGTQVCFFFATISVFQRVSVTYSIATLCSLYISFGPLPAALLMFGSGPCVPPCPHRRQHIRDRCLQVLRSFSLSGVRSAHAKDPATPAATSVVATSVETDAAQKTHVATGVVQDTDVETHGWDVPGDEELQPAWDAPRPSSQATPSMTSLHAHASLPSSAANPSPSARRPSPKASPSSPAAPSASLQVAVSPPSSPANPSPSARRRRRAEDVPASPSMASTSRRQSPAGRHPETPGHRSRAETEFVVVIDRAPGETLGLDAAAEGESGTLRISQVMAGGAIDRWNRSLPPQSFNEVRSGMRIIEVNGQAGRAQALLSMLRQPGSLRITLRAPPDDGGIEVVIDRLRGESLGLDAAAEGENTLRVFDVKAGGAIDRWNRSLPLGSRLEVRSGMRIIAVNGQKGGAASLLSALRVPGTLRILLRPEAGSSTPLSSVASGTPMFRRTLARDGPTPASPHSPRLSPAQLSPASSAAAVRATDFTVEIDHSPGESLGLDAAAEGDKVLRVRDILPGGAVERWNRSLPPGSASEVRPGMRIVEVNGMRGSSASLLTALRQPGELAITFLPERKRTPRRSPVGTPNSSPISSLRTDRFQDSLVGTDASTKNSL